MRDAACTCVHGCCHDASALERGHWPASVDPFERLGCAVVLTALQAVVAVGIGAAAILVPVAIWVLEYGCLKRPHVWTRVDNGKAFGPLRMWGLADESDGCVHFM